MSAFLSPEKVYRQRGPRLVAYVILLFLTGWLALPRAHVASGSEAPETPFAPGEVLVGLRVDAVARFGQSSRLPLWRAVAASEATFLLQGEAGGPAIYRLRVPEGTERQTIERLKAEPDVVFAEPNYRVWAADTGTVPFLPDDPLYRSRQWGVQRIDASRAWQFGAGTAIQVAVVDTGIDFNHPEFAGRLLPGKNYVDPTKRPQDDSGHGTHVAGIIAASLDNGVGIAGLAPQALIDPRKALNSRREGTVADVAQAIRDAADAGARIINLSLWTTSPSATLESAVDYAAGQGVLLVAAVGNRAPDPVGWPAAYPATMAVAATTRDDRRAYYSNRGPEVTIAAPGGTNSDPIVSTWPSGIFCSSPIAPGYCTASGTSLSAAFVSGALALIWGNRPDLTGAQVQAILLETARDIGDSRQNVGAGRLNLREAMRRALLSDLDLQPSALVYLVAPGSAPFDQTVQITNPSRDLIFWQAAVDAGDSWLTLQPSPGGASAGGSVRYGEPAALTLTISPTLLREGSYSGAIRVIGSRSSGSQVVAKLPVNLTVGAPIRFAYMPLATREGSTPGWYTPNLEGRQIVRLTGDSSIGLLLPFTYTLEGQAITTVRLYADGFLTMPATESVASLPLQCLADDTPAQQAVYGWWTDLDPSAGGQISTFQAPDGAFVVEFLDIPTAVGASPAYRVSFQMALYADGTVQLNYRSTPTQPGDVVVGMEVQDSLLYTEIACRKGKSAIGATPRSGDSITIRASDLR